jgi:predicted RNA-binding Zn-ribbon protein involved in translation (DUF1610 family)
MEEKDLEKLRTKQREIATQIGQIQDEISRLSEKVEAVQKLNQDIGRLVEGANKQGEQGTGRLACPQCGNTKVKEMEDKDNVISFIPTPIYGTKYMCPVCKAEWK